MKLKTTRLSTLPFSAERMEQVLVKRSELPRLWGIAVPREWPNPDLCEALPLFYESSRLHRGTFVWDALVIHEETKTLIGDVGFKGGPDPLGRVDLGYSILPAYQGQGFATEIAAAAVAWAGSHPSVRRITAECEETNRASIRVLEKVGFVRMGKEGSLIKWEWRKDKSQ